LHICDQEPSAPFTKLALREVNPMAKRIRICWGTQALSPTAIGASAECGSARQTSLF
jgi:hypothetical protein